MLYNLVLVTYPLDYSRRIYSPLNFRFLQKTKKMCPYRITTIVLPKINLEHLELLRPWGLRASSLEAPGLHDTNLNRLSTQIPRSQEWRIKMMAVFLFIAHEKGFKFHAQPQNGAYSCYISKECIYNII